MLPPAAAVQEERGSSRLLILITTKPLRGVPCHQGPRSMAFPDTRLSPQITKPRAIGLWRLIQTSLAAEKHRSTAIRTNRLSCLESDVQLQLLCVPKTPEPLATITDSKREPPYKATRTMFPKTGRCVDDL